MRLGGYAHSDGITFFCEGMLLKAKKRGNNPVYQFKWIKTPRWMRKGSDHPLLAGVNQLYYQWQIFDPWRRWGLLALMAALLIDELWPISPIRYLLEGNISPYWGWGVMIIFILIRGRKVPRLLRYHGAEHKIINTYGRYGAVDYSMAKSAPCYHSYCGTNVVGLFLGLYGLLYVLGIDAIPLVIGLFLLAFPLARKMAQKPYSQWFFKGLQRITVWEPTEEELRLGIDCFHHLQQAQGIYRHEVKISTQRRNNSL